jgi:hypothetical protein
MSLEMETAPINPNGRCIHELPVACEYYKDVPPPPGGHDITKSSVPFLMVISVLISGIIGAFHLGGIYTDINRERSEVIRRLDNIEVTLAKLLPAYAGIDRKAKAH